MRLFHKILIASFLTFFSLGFAVFVNAQTAAKIIPGTFTNVSKVPSSSSATATAGLQQFYSSTGRYTLSADGIGSTSSSMNIRVNKPNAQATVKKAILLSSVTFGTISDGCVTIAGSAVNWDGSAASTFFHTYWADVTSLVAADINSFSAGLSTLPITECNTGQTDGEALLVVFNDASATEKTIVVMVGALNTAGDNFPVTLAKAIDPAKPGALLDMGLGIGFSYQSNGTQQYSEISVNGQRITTSAGGEDDGQGANGALLTVGGIGDDNLNPSNPNATPTNPRSDDELYSILPFITNTTTSLTINTINPSNDDNVFLAYFSLSGAAIIGEGILLSQTDDSATVGGMHTVTAVVKDDQGNPVASRLVTFTITSGPNAGKTASKNTNSAGEAEYTYTGSGGVGVDSIKACFTNSQNATSCSNTLAFEWTKVPVIPPASTGPCPKNDTVYASTCNGKAVISWTPPSKPYPDTILIPGYPGPGKGVLTYAGILGGHGYYLSKKQTTFTNAGFDFSQFLTGRGTKGHLATLTSAAENAFVTNMVIGAGYSHEIGLFNYLTATNFLWITGEEFKYKNWAAGQPDNGGSASSKIKEHYVVLRTNGTWNDTIPAKLPFVAEFDKPLYVYRKIVGPANGSSQPVGDYTICYERTNLITLIKDTCCFTISVQCSSTQSRAANSAITNAQGLKVISYPNPSHDNFALSIASGKQQSISITITDQLGRVVEARNGIAPNQNLKVGATLKPGLYIIQVVQGTSKVVSKLIKE